MKKLGHNGNWIVSNIFLFFRRWPAHPKMFIEKSKKMFIFFWKIFWIFKPETSARIRPLKN